MGAFVTHIVLGATPANNSRYRAAAPSYRAPFAMAAPADGSRLYVAEETGWRVVEISPQRGTIVRSIDLPGPVGGLALASPEGKRLYVTTAVPQGMVYVFDPQTGKQTSPPIAVGHTPMSPVLSPDGHTLYVCNRFTNDVSIIDLQAGRETARIPMLREPVAAALTPDGKWLLVANLVPVGAATDEVVSAAVTVVNTATRAVVAQLPLPDGSTEVRGICLSPDGMYAYVTHVLGHYKLPTTQVDRGWMNSNALSVIEVAKPQVSGTVLLDNIDRGAANPWGVACSPDGKVLAVTHAGTHELSVIDRAAFHRKLAGADHPENDLTLLNDIRTRIQLPGNGPRGLYLTNDTAYVAQYFSGDLAAVPLYPVALPLPAGGERAGVRGYQAHTISLGPAQKLTTERQGEIYFNDATRCFQHWQSCESCHPESRTDGLNWDLLNDGIGNPKNTKNLLLAHRTPPAMITGIRGNAEEAVRAGMKYIEFRMQPESDAVALDTYLKSMRPVPSPYLVNGQLSPAAERGQKLFAQTGCITCHSGPLYTDLKLHDVGTGRNEEAGRKFDTPTLIESWRTAPYLYDGRAATMREVLEKFNAGDQHGRTSHLSPQELDDLALYVNSL